MISRCSLRCTARTTWRSTHCDVRDGKHEAEQTNRTRSATWLCLSVGKMSFTSQLNQKGEVSIKDKRCQRV
jgi:hypothetical protein